MSTACDVFRLLSSQYKQADLMVRASYFEIYSGKVCAQLVGVLTSSLKGQQPSFYGQSPRPVIGTASVVCGAGSMKLSGVRLSACLSHLVLQPRRAAGLLLCPPCRQTISIDCCTAHLQQARPPFDLYPHQSGSQQQMRAVSCLQRRRKLNTGLLLCRR